MKENLGPSELQLLLMPLPFCSPMGGTDVCPITTGLRAQLLAATGPSPTQTQVTWRTDGLQLHTREQLRSEGPAAASLWMDRGHSHSRLYSMSQKGKSGSAPTTTHQD